MISVPFVEIATITYVLTGDWYQTEGKKLLRETVGQKPVFSNSEIITLLILMNSLPYPGEGQYLGFIRANYLGLFPHLVDQSQFNRRARKLRRLVECIRQLWAEQMGVTLATKFLLDTKPLPVVSYKRSKGHSDFARIWTPVRVNQKIQNPKGFDRWLNALRERIESVYNEIQNT